MVGAVPDNWATGQQFQASDEDVVSRAINQSGWLWPCHAATTGIETFTVASGSVTTINGLTVDGVTLAIGDRLLVKDAPTTSGTGSSMSSNPANGIYQIAGNTTNLTLVRVFEMSATPTTPYNPSGEVVAVAAGTVNTGLTFIVSTPSSPTGTFTWGTGSLQWTPLGYEVGTGLSLVGSVIQLSSASQANLALAATSLQSATGVLSLSGSAVHVASMATGTVIFGNAGAATIGALSGDATISSAGALTVGAGAITLSKMATLAANSVIGNSSGSSATPSAIALAVGATASAVALRDVNANITANVFISGVTSTATGGSTTTLTAASAEVQQFTGTATQTCVAPNATTLAVGHRYLISNRSTGAVTVQANGGTTLQTMAAQSQLILTLISNGSSAGVWDVAYTTNVAVTSLSVATANGLAGTSSGGTAPTLTLSTTVTGLLKGNGTAISAATSGTDYAPATSGTAILKGNNAGGFTNAVAGTDYAPITSGTSALAGNGSGGFQNATLNMVATPTANFSMGGFLLNSLGTPASSTDAATKGYVDALIQGISAKYSAEAATTGVETYTIVSGSVTTINGTTLDGVSPNINDYILVKDAPATSGTGSVGSTGTANGLYQISGNTTNLTLTRALDMSGSVSPVGAFVFVTGGTANANSGWVVSVPSTSGSFTYGSSNIKWVQFSGAGEITAGAGLAKSGNTLSIENSGVLLPAHGGTGSASITGLVKGNGTSAYSAAVAGTDYAPATSGSSLLKGNGSGGFSNATSGTDYAPATSGSSLLKGSGSGGFSNAVSGTDYAPATSGSSALAGNGSGGFVNAILNNVGTPTAAYSMGGFGFTNLANPVNSQDSATKIYVDSTANPWCRVATTGTETFTIVSGTVSSISGTVVDGVSPSIGDRLLIKDAPISSGTGTILSSVAANGIYVVTGNTTNLTVSRAADMSSGAAVATPAGATVEVAAGTANAVTLWKVVSPNSSTTFTYGTTAIQWTPGIATTGTVLARSGNALGIAAMSTGQAIIGNAGSASIATISGAISIGATGVATIANSVVTPAMMNATGTASSTTFLRGDGAWATPITGSGTVTTASVASANGFAGTVATATTTPAITLTTTVTGLLKGNGTAISAATAGTDYSTPSVTETLTNKTITFTNNNLGRGVYTTQVGDGSSTTFTVTHNLGTQNVMVRLYSSSTFAVVNADEVRTDANGITLTFASAPALDAYIVVIMAAQFAATIGNGSSTSIAVTHNLGTQNVIVDLYNVSTGATVNADIVRTSGSVVTLGFASAPTPSSIGVMVSTAPYAVAVGNGSSTNFTVTHNLGTRNVIVDAYSVATGATVNVDRVYTNNSSVALTFASAPTSGAVMVLVSEGGNVYYSSTDIVDASLIGREILTAANAAAVANLLTINPSVPYDLSIMGAAATTTRAVGLNDNTFGVCLQRGCVLTSVTYRVSTADASGSSTFVLYRNGSPISGSSLAIATGNQTNTYTSNNTVTFSQTCVIGDIIEVYCSSAGTTPGLGLVADVTGTANSGPGGTGGINGGTP